MKKILIAPDKFKGTLTAPEVAAIIVQELRAVFPAAEPDICPIADGGEGTAEAIITAKNGHWVECPSLDARHRPVLAKYGLTHHAGKTQAVMEMSAASGLAQVSDIPPDPSLANTYGTGLLLLDALGRGARRIIIGIGGSATNDGGAGMARALGFRFLDAEGGEITELPGGLDRLEKILPPQKFAAELLVACDVTNPLLGSQGCTRVYGAQKGVKDPAWFETRLQRLADTVLRDLGTDAEHLPGAGAAGGLGYGLMVFCGGELAGGFDTVAEIINLAERIAAADIVITGEGRLDCQTLHGKGPIGVAKLARSLGKPVIGIAGVIESEAREALQAHFDALIQVKPEQTPSAEAMRRSRELLAQAARDALAAQLRCMALI